MYHHAKNVANQDEIRVAIGDHRGMGVIEGERNDRVVAFPIRDLWNRNPAVGLFGAHGLISL